MAEKTDITANDDVTLSGAKLKSLVGKKIILIPIVVLLLTAEIVGAYYTVNLLFFSKMPPLPENKIVQADSAEIAPVELEILQKGKGELYDFADIVVNPAGTGGRRYLVISMTFELSDKKVVKEVSEKEPILRDALLTHLAAKHFDYVTEVANIEEMRKEMQDILNKHLEKGKVLRIYFTGYVLQ